MTAPQQKMGFFALVGKPNAGKSSLLNALVGQKVSIVSFKPQTTRNKIMGIYSGDDHQMVFLDTPGFIRPDNLLSEYMHKEIATATDFVDGIIFVLDSTSSLDNQLQNSLQRYAKQNLIVAINKVDIGGFEKVYPLIERIQSLVPNATILPLSAKTKQNIDVLLQTCKNISPLGDPHFDKSQVTDKTMRFIAAETIREKILLQYEEEIPHGVSVVITLFQEKPTVTVIEAEIICNKESHKPIIIGNNGNGIKNIGQLARLELQDIIGTKIYLKLFVKVRKDWKDNQNFVNDFGYKIN